MADSSIAITGGNVDTRTAGNGDHRQVVVLGADGDTVAALNADQEVFVRAGRRPANLHVTATAATGVAATATLPAGGANTFHYITRIAITAYSTAARTGSATALAAPTTTNIPGSMVWTFATAAAIGTTDHREIVFNSPLKVSAANTNTTIVGTATTSIIWRIAVDYYLSV